MTRLAHWLLCWTLAMVPAAFGARAEPVRSAPKPDPKRHVLCRPGRAEPSISGRLRDRPTAICPYDLEALNQRIGELLDNPQGRGFNVQKAQYRFGLPTMSSYYESDRIASYGMGVSGAGGWKMQLSAQEAKYPLSGAPGVCVRRVHPKRLVEVDALSVRYDIALIMPEDALVTGQCMRVEDAARTLERAGWRDDTAFANLSARDGGHANPTYRAPKGGTSIILDMEGLGHVATREERSSHCLTGLTVMQPPLDEISSDARR